MRDTIRRVPPGCRWKASSPLTTKHYAHLADDPLRAAAERIGSKMAAMQTANGAEIVELVSRR